MFDLLVRGGQVVDAAAELNEPMDVAVHQGRIAAIDKAIPKESAVRVVEAAGKLVVPGLIDLHSHVFRGVGYFGIDADSVASRSGVTTWIDAGSAGAFSLPGFREYVIERSRVRVRAFMNISYLGLGGLNYDEYCNLNACNVDLFERVANANTDVVVGVKTRMGTAAVGSQGLEPLHRARIAAERCGLPLMVHIADAPPKVSDVLRLLRHGDILTHSFTGLGMSLVDKRGRIVAAAREAKESGVIFDVGHGSGSFSFKSAEALTAAGVWPDVISTDLHQVSMPGPDLIDPFAQEVIARVRGEGEPQFTLLTVMSKFLHLGMRLTDVLAAASYVPARVLKLHDEIGTLKRGARADIAILQLERGSVEFFDVHGNSRTARESLAHVMTIVGGEPLDFLPLPEPPPWIRLVDREQLG